MPNGARRDVMRSTEGRKEIVKRVFVGQIDDRQPRAPLILIAVKNIIDAH